MLFTCDVSVVAVLLCLTTVGCAGGGERNALPTATASSLAEDMVVVGETTSPSTEGVYARELLQACEPGARAYEGVPIAAFNHPSEDGLVVCWADGRVAKSPPPVHGSVPPDFDRLVFTATMDGDSVELLQAGYRNLLTVSPP